MKIRGLLPRSIVIFALLIFFVQFGAAAEPRVLIDGKLDDWTTRSSLWSSTASTSGGNVTLQEVKAFNDNTFLFIYFKTAEFFSLQEDFALKLYIDTDNNSATGLALDTMGADIEFDFGSRAGVLHGNTDSDLSFSNLFMVTAPTVWSDKYEISIRKYFTNAAGDTVLVMTPKIKIKMKDDSVVSGGSETPILNYTFDSYNLEPLPSYSITKGSADHLRVVSHNVEFDGFFETENFEIYERLYSVVNPDIIGFSEIYNHSDEQLCAQLEKILPSSGGKFWNAAHIADNFIATRYSILGAYSCGGYGNGAFYIDMRPDYNSNALVIVAHPPCCTGNDDARSDEIDAIAAFIRDTKNAGGDLTIPSETPIIILGDMNLVGNPHQWETLLTGNIDNEVTFGADFFPDWDKSNFEDALPYVTNLPMAFTQGVGTNPGKYSKGRLDVTIYSGSVLDLHNSFILYTNALSASELASLGLQKNDTEAASDHFPLVSDFTVKAQQDLSIADLRYNNSEGISTHLDNVITVGGTVTVANEFGTAGPAYIQDDQAGIAVYGADLVSQLSPGDNITITSKVGFYNGLTQFIYTNGISAITVNSNTAVPAPRATTIAEIQGQAWNGQEMLEGLLIKLENVTFQESGTFAGNTNYIVSDGVNTLNIRIDTDTDLPGNSIPDGTVNIVGVLSQYDNSSPYSEGYQLLPRTLSDITEGGQSGESATILDLRQNDETGVPVHLNEIVTVSGTVTTADEFGTAGPAYIQDDQAGIAVYGADFISQLSPGDNITITSKIGFYNGLTQFVFVDTVSSVIVNGIEIVPEPRATTIAEIQGQAWNGQEMLEGLLIKLENVTFQEGGTFAGNTNYIVSDGVNTLNIRIDTDTDLPGNSIPDGTVNIVGILSQYDNSSPYSEGYQLLPRTLSDITEGGQSGGDFYSYSFDQSGSDPLMSTWSTGTGSMDLLENRGLYKEGTGSLQSIWSVNHSDEWGGTTQIIYKQTAPVEEYFSLADADYLTLWVFNTEPASQSGKTLFEFTLLDADERYDGNTTSAEHWVYRKTGVLDMEPGWNRVRMPLIDRGSEFPTDQGFSAPGWNGIVNNGRLDKGRIVGWLISIVTDNTQVGETISGATIFDQLEAEVSAGGEYTVTFQADLTELIASGWFDPSDSADSVVVNGDFNGWSSNSKMVPDGTNPNIYTYSVTVSGMPGDVIAWKFRLLPNTKWLNSGWENIDSRQLTLTGEDIVLDPIVPVVSPQSSVTSQDVTVTFSVDMSGLNDSFSAVSLQGEAEPLNWYPGSTPMSDPEGDGVYTADILFPAGTGTTNQYKYTVQSATGDWTWETFEGNRVFNIDDESDTQVLEIDIFNNRGNVSGGSVYFSGQHARIRVTDNNPINPEANPGAYVITGNSITVEAWVFPMNVPANGGSAVLVSRPYYNADPWYAYELRINNYGSEDKPCFDFAVSDGSPGGLSIGAMNNTPITIGEWAHVAGTYDGSSLRLYVNGDLAAEVPFSVNIGTGNAGLYIGGHWTGFFNGVIDEVRLWNVCRTQNEIRTAMNTALTGNETGLAGYWPLDEFTTVGEVYPVVADLTDNHNDMQAQYGAAWISATPPDGIPQIEPTLIVQDLYGISGNLFGYYPVSTGWPEPDISLVSGPAGMVLSENQIIWTAGEAGFYDITLEAVNSSGSDQATYSLWVDAVPVNYANLENNTSLTIYNNGSIGDNQDGSGIGFQYNSVNGLYKGSVIIGHDTGQVSGQLYAPEFGPLTEVHSVPGLLPGFDQAFQSRFNDQRCENPINLEITQRTHVNSTPPDDDYMILEYNILNKSGADLTGIYVGLAMDWDVGPDPAQNRGGYDSENKISYAFNSDELPYFGVTALTGNVSGHKIWSINDGNMEGNDDFLYAGLSEFTPEPEETTDIRAILGTGPYSIRKDSSITVFFAVIGGDDLADLQTNATAAQAVELSSEEPEISHFIPVYSGNPYLAMNIYVTAAMIDGVTLNAGDEIGIFDGDICVGSGVVTGNFDPYLALVASTDDPTTTEKDGFTVGNPISYRLWDRVSDLEISSVQPSYSSGNGTFGSQGTAVVSLTGSLSISQTLNLAQGWNIVSFYAKPGDCDILNIFQDLTANENLIKIQDETGNAVENITGIGWVNNINNLAATEGYYVKVASDQSLSIEGSGITLPLDIPLSAGWNIMGYPVSSAQNALNIVQPLINDGTLLKVQDETGKAIEELPVIGWQNGIGDFKPGKGYYIKTNSATVATVTQPSKSAIAKSSSATDSALPPHHYLPITTTNPYLPMNVYVMTADVEGEPLQAGAEIAVYYHDKCIAAAALSNPLSAANTYLPLVVGADDPLSEEIDGFDENAPIAFKIWDGREELPVIVKTVSYADNSGLLKFNARGTIVVNLEGQRIPKEYSLHQNYPNPFNPNTTLRYELPQAGKVELRIFDLQGRQVNQLVSENQPPGKYSVIWNGCDSRGNQVPSGIYLFQLKCGSFSKTRKAVLMK